ncbi:TPA: conjugative transfer ATPase [Klebsiella pneumoniae]|jgi:conjugative transfer ATPase|uniref:Putative plasmid-related protein n=1 Tax=Enterobacter cloacae subsp. cloacae (strain ATCC 13047 / DSM 30054 / NBRC 13535 / NCTC 10005 / WDCM 00083 / NCDC 279-56) TaxID=716541 RepID=A0A0H3CFI4_ENTCC|nr:MULTISPECIES: conjugative transfer ATPase [Enterobacteriaceae]AUU88915.1 conjugative transfer ATPase [Enterobacteriaceae bacterium ENNIH3]AUV05794.1 conjugative transfer ATPase [Enterobacteriaceae bacterium ENNIH2]EBA1947703.1 conjugative transfer ATPase [Salmonella enterica]EDX3259324.1 conjugative transfer ATPase [Salmonella enterica subsp. enterica serovar Mbandaka]ELD7981843.1 conjugative transfer ATPase [Enterobacter hormaechei]MDU4295326.1 conjugative transfer ATPase [Enterobacter as
MAFSLFRRRAEAQEAHQYGDGPFSVNGHEPLTREGRLTRSEEAKLYETAPSIIDHIPWGEYLPEHQCILLDDGVSVGAVYEIIPVGTEGRPDSRLEEIRDVVENALQDSLPELDTHQWVVQFYCQDESDLMVYMDKIRGYVKPRAQGTDFTDAWLREQARHLQNVATEKGLFVDEAVTGAPWRGQIRRTRMVIYRWVESPYRDPMAPEVLLKQVCDRLTAAMSGAGIQCQRQNGEQIHSWLLRWFNPEPTWVDKATLYRCARHTDDAPGELPLLNDFSESLWFTRPRSDAEKGVWWFDDVAHRAVPVARLRSAPTTGHLTGEVRRGDNINAIMDLLPEGTVLVMTLVIHPQDKLEENFARLSRDSMGENVDSLRAREDAATARTYLGNKHKLYRAAITLLIKARDLPSLDSRYLDLSSKLLNCGLEPVNPEHDIGPLSTYMRALPMCFNPEQDRHNWYTRLMFVQHFACLAPVYGRDTGTGNPGFTFFNRGGGPLSVDPLNKNDRTQNAHLLLFGPTGAGKSATALDKLAQMIAIYRSRIFLLEAGNSFGLAGDYFESLGLTVHRVSIKPGKAISLAPFGDSHLLMQEKPDELIISEDALPDIDDDEDKDEKRDVLGEMEIAARLMITGGEPAEEQRMTRADRGMIREAIMIAARSTFEAGRQMLPEDLMFALQGIARDAGMGEDGRERRTAARRARAEEMSEALRMFTEGFEGELFNRPGTPWPEADVTIVDLGTLAREGYEAQMAVAVISLLNTINNIAEREQYSDRDIIVSIDEAHIVTANPLMGPYATKIVKMWRKLGAWLWLFTQNLADFPDTAKKMLNMAEWWICLVMPPDEVEQIARFKTLNSEQKAMLLSATKLPKKYTEGVILSRKVQALFRAVPPSLYLALGMTEKEEKAERRLIMNELQCSELEAAFHVARRLDENRGLSI